nr:MAG TPA: hypothetical protein [Bacteriophage sp.]
MLPEFLNIFHRMIWIRYLMQKPLGNENCLVNHLNRLNNIGKHFSFPIFVYTYIL